MIGIPFGYALVLLLTALLLFIALAYILLWLLSSSRSAALPAGQIEAQKLPRAREEHSTKSHRVASAVILGFVWFFLWVLVVNILFSYPLPYHNVLSRAFGYATIILWGPLATVWVGVKLYKRRAKGCPLVAALFGLA
jgi:hypothetical protein